MVIRALTTIIPPCTTICTTCATLCHLYSRGTCVHRREGFVIRHFAGEVLYSSHGFLDKNTDVLHASLDRHCCTVLAQWHSDRPRPPSAP